MSNKVIKTNVTKYYEHKFSFRLCDEDDWTDVAVRSTNEELTVDDFIDYLSEVFVVRQYLGVSMYDSDDCLTFIDDVYTFSIKVTDEMNIDEDNLSTIIPYLQFKGSKDEK